MALFKMSICEKEMSKYITSTANRPTVLYATI